MPLIQKTVYVREADVEKWNALPNKAEFIHNALNGRGGTRLGSKEPFGGTVIKTKRDAAEAVKEVFPDAKPIEPVTYKKTQNWGA